MDGGFSAFASFTAVVADDGGTLAGAANQQRDTAGNLSDQASLQVRYWGMVNNCSQQWRPTWACLFDKIEKDEHEIDKENEKDWSARKVPVPSSLA